MGWKAVKDYYKIGHVVQVRPEGVCIGSCYVHDLIVISPDGEIRVGDLGIAGHADLERYYHEMSGDKAKLAELVAAQDSFAGSIPVYTFNGGDILLKHCEALGYPNVTHDGELMYENSFSPDISVVVRWAKRNAASAIGLTDDIILRLRTELSEAESRRAERVRILEKLNSEYPDDDGAATP